MLELERILLLRQELAFVRRREFETQDFTVGTCLTTSVFHVEHTAPLVIVTQTVSYRRRVKTYWIWKHLFS